MVFSKAVLIKHITKKIYFKNIYLFLEYIKDITAFKGEELVRINL